MKTFTSDTDSANHLYVEVEPLPGHDDRIRLTWIPAPPAGYQQPSVRVQIKPQGTAPRPGPEIPVSALRDVMLALAQLLDRSQT